MAEDDAKPKGILSSGSKDPSDLPEEARGESSAIAKFKGQVKALKFAQDMARKVEERRSMRGAAADGDENALALLAADDTAAKAQEEVELLPGGRKSSKEDKTPLSALELAKRRAMLEEKADEEEMLSFFKNAKKHEFKPQPLHVRSLCLQARRACDRELQREAPRLKAAEALYGDQKDDRAGRFQSVFAAEVNLMAAKRLTEEELEDLEVTVKRLRYTVGLLERRKERLSKLDWTTFRQLPDQLVEAGGDGDLEFAMLCADAAVPLDIYDQKGVTALTAATVGNKVSTACLLLERKADPSMQDMNGACSVHYAIELKRYQILDAALVAMQKSKNWIALYVKDARSKTVLDYARAPGREESLRLLKLRLGGPLGLIWTVTNMNLHNSVFQVQEGKVNQKQITKLAAKMAAQRHGDHASTKHQLAKDKAREKVLGGSLCSFCSIAKISEKKLQELIHHDVPEDDYHGGLFDDIDYGAAQKLFV